MSQGRFTRTLAIISFVGLTFTFHGFAAAQTPQSTPAQLVNQVVKMELKAAEQDSSHWMYRQHHMDPQENEVKECVETREGVICRKLEEDGKKLSPQQSSQEFKRIEEQLTDREKRRREEKSRKEDAEKALAMLKMLPSAFIYTYAGGDSCTTRLKFTPNPNFRPPSREARVFHEMSGTLIVDKLAKRLVALQGHLIRNVEFGAGLLGHLEKGGTFEVRRTNVGDEHWETTLLNVDIHGKALFFKTINAQQHEVTGYFRRVSDDLTLARGVDLLTSPVPTGVPAKEGQALARSR